MAQQQLKQLSETMVSKVESRLGLPGGSTIGELISAVSLLWYADACDAAMRPPVSREVAEYRELRLAHHLRIHGQRRTEDEIEALAEADVEQWAQLPGFRAIGWERVEAEARQLAGPLRAREAAEQDPEAARARAAFRAQIGQLVLAYLVRQYGKPRENSEGQVTGFGTGLSATARQPGDEVHLRRVGAAGVSLEAMLSAAG